MGSYFFRVEHDLLRSDVFKTLGGSAVKVYLVIGLYSDFGTDWAYPSTRTIAHYTGLSRQTVMSAIVELTTAGVLIASRSIGRSTAYRILREPVPTTRPARKHPTTKGKFTDRQLATGPESLEVPLLTGLENLDVNACSGPESLPPPVQIFDISGQGTRPNQQSLSRDHQTTTIPIPGTPFRVTAEGKVLVAVDLHQLLTDQGIPTNLAMRIVAQKDPEVVAKVLLNAFYLQSQGKLHNGAGYIRAGIESGYDLLPQVASRLEDQRRELKARLHILEVQQAQKEHKNRRAADEAAITYIIEQLGPGQVQYLVEKAIRLLPEPLVRHNQTLSNPFIRGKVYELACGEPMVQVGEEHSIT